MQFKAKKETKKVKTDVLIVGGGTAGFVAAIAAARNGAKVIIVEQHDYLGGSHSGGMVMMIRSMRHMRAPKDPKNLYEKKLMMAQYESSFDDQQVVYSIAQEYLDRMIEVKAAWGKKGHAAARQLFDPEIAKWVIDSMVMEAGVDVWFYSQATDMLMEGNRVKGLVIENLLERTEIEAAVTIDTTGDGEVCAAAGAPFEKGNPTDGLSQPLTLYFNIGGVNFEKSIEYMKANPLEFGQEYVDTILRLIRENKPITLLPLKGKIKEAVANGDYPIPYGLTSVNPETATYLNRPMFRNGKFRYESAVINMDMAYNIDTTSRAELTKATIAMRNMAVKMVDFYRKYVPGYEDAYLIHTAPFIGVRDSRRIICDYFLTQEDVLSGKAFDDSIGRYGSVVDVHDKDGKESVRLVEVGGPGWFQIPYRTLLPQGVENLLVAGRCIAADYVAQGATRSQAACMITGQAAGTAAALAIKAGVTPRKVDIAALQDVLSAQNQKV